MHRLFQSQFFYLSHRDTTTNGFSKEPVRKEKSLRHFHVTTVAAQPSSCSVAHVYMLACSKQKVASCCTVNTKKEAFKWIIT